MSKQEFIDRLRVALNGNVSSVLVQENINYYEDYINTEIRKGREEAEVLQSLGDPRLIARTIVETHGMNDRTETQGAGNQGDNYRNTYQGSSWNNAYQENAEVRNRGFRIPGLAWALIVMLIIFVIMSLVFSVLSFLAPVIMPVIVVVFLVKLFRDWLN